jgi:succinate dehydrogenase / fumarate reductase, flavoprotein subunit
MSALESYGTVIETDVLVIGGGYAGLWAAKKVREESADVLIVEKGPPMGLAGQAYFSGGNIQAAPPGADPMDHVKDAVYLGDGLYEQDLVERIFAQSWDRIEEFKRLGVRFLEKDGKPWAIPQRGLKHLLCFPGEPVGHGGETMMAALTKEATRLGAKYLQRVYVTDILRREGVAVGAVGFDTKSGSFYLFKAGAVILAAGQCCMKGHYEDQAMSCGDGIALAYKAGAQLKNMEFNSIWVIPKYFRWEGITHLLPLGARFVDGKGEAFIEKYSPVLKSNIDYNYLVRFMALEARKGNGPFFLDCSRMTPVDMKRMEPTHGWAELQYRKMLEAGIRPFDTPQEWTAGMGSLSGGVHSDPDMQTRVPGLFVAGKVRTLDPGIYFGGWSLCQSAATANWAAESAVRFIRSTRRMSIDRKEVARFKKSLYAPLERGGTSPDQALMEMQKAVFPYEVLVLKSEARLKEALSRVEEIKGRLLSRMAAKDVRQLMRLAETRSISLAMELFLRASLLRTETRTSHYREDYPGRDDRNWLKWLFVEDQEGSPVFSRVPVPLDKYKFRPDRFYMDNFTMPSEK